MQTEEKMQTRTHGEQAGGRQIKRGATTSTLYFAYGSNLNLEQMMGRCPTARMLGPLTLPDWRLEFRGVADIVPYPGAEVAGALYRVWEQDELALDRYEGFRPSDPDGGLYRKVFHKVQDAEGRIEPFMFYVMNQDGIHPPQRYYLETIQQGYADWNLRAETLDAAVLRSQRGQSSQRWEDAQAEIEECFTGDLFGEEYSNV